MAEKENPKKKEEAKQRTSVRSYKEGVELEKQKMNTYSKKFVGGVKLLKGEFKKHSKDMKEAAQNLRAEGIKNMSEKVGRFKKDIQEQVKENKDAVVHMEDNIKYFTSEINKEKKGFRSYAQGPFKEYIKNFQG